MTQKRTGIQAIALMTVGSLMGYAVATAGVTRHQV
jgi:hypothetical protein